MAAVADADGGTNSAPSGQIVPGAGGNARGGSVTVTASGGGEIRLNCSANDALTLEAYGIGSSGTTCARRNARTGIISSAGRTWA